VLDSSFDTLGGNSFSLPGTSDVIYNASLFYEKAGFSASGTINRKDFGLAFNAVMESGGLVVADDVNIKLEIEGNKRPS